MKLTIKRGGKVAAWMRIERCGDGREISFLRVEPEHRRQGLARQLMDKAQSLGCALVALPDPDKDGMTTQQMKEWLLRRGFKHCWYYFDEIGKAKRALIWEPPTGKSIDEN